MQENVKVTIMTVIRTGFLPLLLLFTIIITYFVMYFVQFSLYSLYFNLCLSVSLSVLILIQHLCCHFPVMYYSFIIHSLLLPSSPFSERRRYRDARRPSVCVCPPNRDCTPSAAKVKPNVCAFLFTLLSVLRRMKIFKCCCIYKTFRMTVSCINFLFHSY